MSLGPLMIDLAATELGAEERELLAHPLVGGVILFTRNYVDPEQLTALVTAIHAVREPQLLVAVDHEGGRVQRFREGLTRLPAAALFGELYERDARRARQLAETSGWLMAVELRSLGVDFSFAPVLDLNFGVSTVIGDRAFHRRPDVVAELAQAYMRGMQHAGMAATGKHFPGHGAVRADSHLELPIDSRRYEDILVDDLVPFERMIGNGLAAVMPAHVVYSKVDARPAGFSPFWIKEVLRKRLGFQGVVFSDDLHMEAAGVAGDYVERAHAALQAGCDMALVCNDRAGAVQILDGLGPYNDPVAHMRLARMHGRHPITREALQHDPAWKEAIKNLEDLDHTSWLELDV
jgi:beta-N-acetylhexosaminidase